MLEAPREFANSAVVSARCRNSRNESSAKPKLPCKNFAGAARASNDEFSECFSVDHALAIRGLSLDPNRYWHCVRWPVRNLALREVGEPAGVRNHQLLASATSCFNFACSFTVSAAALFFSSNWSRRRCFAAGNVSIRGGTDDFIRLNFDVQCARLVPLVSHYMLPRVVVSQR